MSVRWLLLNWDGGWVGGSAEGWSCLSGVGLVFPVCFSGEGLSFRVCLSGVGPVFRARLGGGATTSSSSFASASASSSGSGSGEAGLFLEGFTEEVSVSLGAAEDRGVEVGFCVKKLEMVGCLRFKDGDGAEDDGEDWGAMVPQ